MKISRIFNNNSVGVVLPDGREAVLVGPGLGWNKRRGDAVNEVQIEKRYILEQNQQSQGMRSILVSLPLEIVELTSAIARRLSQLHHIDLSPVVEIGLADHLAAAFERLDTRIELSNNLLFETKATYRREFEIALEVLEWTEDLTGRRLPLDEAGFIALHLVNAGLTGNMMETQRIASAVTGVMAIVREWMPLGMPSDQSHIERFLTHLKFVLRRLTESTQLSGSHENMFAMMKVSEPESFDCAVLIAAYLQRTFGDELSTEEVLYLVIHLARLRHGGSGSGESA
ncbi:PRD domain-containing protein [Actinomycetaceae bacterium L2_0104]